MKISKELLNPVLEKLYNVYLGFVEAKKVERDVMKKQSCEAIIGCITPPPHQMLHQNIFI